MSILHALLLSIVEGFTEFLPISSTGHLILVSDLLRIVQTDFVKTFEISIQLGAILAVVVLYWKTVTTNFKLWRKIIVAFIPAAGLGFIFYQFIKDILIGNPLVVLAALFMGGLALLVVEKLYKEPSTSQVEELENMSDINALIIGVFQSVSMIPGVSRAAATIVGGILVGLNRKSAVEFSFLLAIPTMFAATALDLLKSGLTFSPNEFSLLIIGFIGAFITAILAVKFLLSFVQKHTFIPFAIYRILIAIIFLRLLG